MRHPPCPPPVPSPCAPDMESVLLPRIIARDRCMLSGVCASLTVSPCPPGSLRMRSAEFSGAPCSWTPFADACGRPGLRMRVPLLCQLCDDCGLYTWCASEAEADVFLPRHFSPLSRGLLLIWPCVRLICAEPSSCGVFQAQLSIQLELYLCRPAPMGLRPPKPAPAPLPLYPPPVYPSRC